MMKNKLRPSLGSAPVYGVVMPRRGLAPINELPNAVPIYGASIPSTDSVDKQAFDSPDNSINIESSTDSDNLLFVVEEGLDSVEALRLLAACDWNLERAKAVILASRTSHNKIFESSPHRLALLLKEQVK